MLSVATSKASLKGFVGLFLVRALWSKMPLVDSALSGQYITLRVNHMRCPQAVQGTALLTLSAAAVAQSYKRTDAHYDCTRLA